VEFTTDVFIHSTDVAAGRFLGQCEEQRYIRWHLFSDTK